MMSILVFICKPKLDAKKFWIFAFYFVEYVCLTCRHRPDFLGHMKPNEAKGNNSLTGPASGNWTLVDEGGEEVRRFIMTSS